VSSVRRKLFPVIVEVRWVGCHLVMTILCYWLCLVLLVSMRYIAVRAKSKRLRLANHVVAVFTECQKVHPQQYSLLLK